MNATQKCHALALTEVFELVLLGSVIALVADTGWVVHDIFTNGFSYQYGLIGGGLLLATIITAYAFLIHHMKNFHRNLKRLLRIKYHVEHVSVERRKHIRW